MGMDVDEFRLQLGIQNGLAAVQPAVAGQQIADGAGRRKIGHPARAEQLHAEDHRGDGAVHSAAEHRHQRSLPPVSSVVRLVVRE